MIKINDKYINLYMSIDMKEGCRLLFNEVDYDKFIDRVKNDREYRKDIIDKLNNHFNLINYILISNANYDIWYYAKYIECNKKYSLLHEENIGNLNNYNDYIDLFGNKIKFGK